MKRVYLGALALVLVPLAGCATFGLAPPDVSLVSLRFTDLQLFETSSVVTVRLANENPEPLQVEGGAFNLYLGGLKVGKGLSDSRFEIPPLSSVTEEVELHISNLAVATRLKSILDSGVVDYRIKAKVYVGHGYGRRSLATTHEGSFDFRRQEPAGEGVRKRTQLDGR